MARRQKIRRTMDVRKAARNRHVHLSFRKVKERRMDGWQENRLVVKRITEMFKRIISAFQLLLSFLQSVLQVLTVLASKVFLGFQALTKLLGLLQLL